MFVGGLSFGGTAFIINDYNKKNEPINPVKIPAELWTVGNEEVLHKTKWNVGQYRHIVDGEVQIITISNVINVKKKVNLKPRKHEPHSN